MREKERRKYWTRAYVAKRKGDLIDIEFSQNVSKKETEDTSNRKAIQNEIIKYIKENRDKEETINYLLEKYKDTNLSMYIPQWYEHHYTKLKQKDKNEDEGR